MSKIIPDIACIGRSSIIALLPQYPMDILHKEMAASLKRTWVAIEEVELYVGAVWLLAIAGQAARIWYPHRYR